LDLAAATVITNSVTVTNTLNPQNHDADLPHQRHGASASASPTSPPVRQRQLSLVKRTMPDACGQHPEQSREVSLPTTALTLGGVAGRISLAVGLPVPCFIFEQRQWWNLGFATVHAATRFSTQTNFRSVTPAPAGLPVYFVLDEQLNANVQWSPPAAARSFSVNGGADAGPVFPAESGTTRLTSPAPPTVRLTSGC